MKDRRIYLNQETVDLMKFPYKFLTRNSGFVYFFCVVIGLPIMVLLQAFMKMNLLDFPGYFKASMGIPYLFMYIVILCFDFGYRRAWLLGYNKFKPWNLLLCPALVVVAYPGLMLISEISRLIFPMSALTISSDTELLLKAIGPVWGFLLLALAPAITEEALCRGLIYGVFRQRGFWPAFIMSTLSFALLHGNVEQILYTAAFGAMLCIVREFTRSAVPCVLMHFLFNSVSTFMIYFADRLGAGSDTDLAQEAASNTSISIALIIAGAISLAATGALLYLSKRVNKYDPEKAAKGNDKDAPAFSAVYLGAWLVAIVLNIIF